MKKIVCITILLLSVLFTYAQGYNVAGGIRMGTDWGITGKYRVAKRATIEGIFQSSLKREEVLVTALYEKHSPILTRGFNIYTGIGLHKGWNSEPVTGDAKIKDPFGVTAIAGVEFNLGKTSISWDFKPAFNLSGGTRTLYSQTGISLRYAFVKRPLFNKKKKKKRQKERAKKKKEKEKAKKKGKKDEQKKINWKFWENW